MLRALRKACEHCDVVLRSNDGAEFWAHRFVLAARYTGVGAFFSGSEERTGFLFESMPEHEDIVWPPLSEAVVSDLSSEILDLLIDLSYVPNHERGEFLMSVLHDDELLDPKEAECAFEAILEWIAGNAEDSEATCRDSCR